MNRFVTRLRGALIAHLFCTEHRLTEAGAEKSAAATLMGTDTDGIATGTPRCLEIPIGFLEIGLGIYLLSHFIDVSALTVFVPLVVTTLPAYFTGRHMSTLFANWNKSIEVRVAKTSKILPQLTAIKMLGLGHTIGTFFQRLRIEEIKTSKSYRLMQAFSVAPLLLGDLMTPVVVIASALFGHAFLGRMAADKVFPILTVVSLIQRPLATVLQSFSIISSTQAFFSRIQDFLCLPDMKDSRVRPSTTPSRENRHPVTRDQERRASAPHQAGRIQFDHADIAPYGATTPLLHGLNFELAPGSITGIVGFTGAGKVNHHRGSPRQS